MNRITDTCENITIVVGNKPQSFSLVLNLEDPNTQIPIYVHVMICVFCFKHCLVVFCGS